MIKKSFLSDQCKEIILGSLLGNGSLKIRKPEKNAQFSFRHLIRQKEYFFWKVEQLKEISSESCWWEQKKNGLEGEMLRYQSLALPALTEIYKLTHKKNKLAIRRKWLNQMSLLSLAVWWLDSGSIINNGRKGVFCTDRFSYKEQEILARYLKVVWRINVHLGKIKRRRDGKEVEYYRLWLRASEELKKFLRIILPFVKVKEMLPKVILLYTDSQLQQRWISEVSQLTGFSQTIIRKYVIEKKSKWQYFRK